MVALQKSGENNRALTTVVINELQMSVMHYETRCSLDSFSVAMENSVLPLHVGFAQSLEHAATTQTVGVNWLKGS